jgi:hypothetical protein
MPSRLYFEATIAFCEYEESGGISSSPVMNRKIKEF